MIKNSQAGKVEYDKREWMEVKLNILIRVELWMLKLETDIHGCEATEIF